MDEADDSLFVEWTGPAWRRAAQGAGVDQASAVRLFELERLTVDLDIPIQCDGLLVIEKALDQSLILKPPLLRLGTAEAVKYQGRG